MSLVTKTKFNGIQYTYRDICIIFEECDATENNVLLSRTIRNSDKDEKSDQLAENMLKLIANKNMDDCTPLHPLQKKEKFNLGCFLNYLDGINEYDGLVIMMTTNHPELLDPALIRSGRFNFKYEFKKASCNLIKKMVSSIYDLSDKELQDPRYLVEYKKLNVINDGVLSPADIQRICFQNIFSSNKYNNFCNCIAEILKSTQKE